MSAKVTSRGNRSRRFSQREQVSVCAIKLCIILVSRHLRDAGTSKPQSLNASSTPTERTITSYRTEEPVSDDVSLDLDDTDDPVARTLDYEGLHASLPSFLPR